MFDHFVGFTLKGLKIKTEIWYRIFKALNVKKIENGKNLYDDHIICFFALHNDFFDFLEQSSGFEYIALRQNCRNTEFFLDRIFLYLD